MMISHPHHINQKHTIRIAIIAVHFADAIAAVEGLITTTSDHHHIHLHIHPHIHLHIHHPNQHMIDTIVRTIVVVVAFIRTHIIANNHHIHLIEQIASHAITVAALVISHRSAPANPTQMHHHVVEIIMKVSHLTIDSSGRHSMVLKLIM
jgi:hypothetical protein